MAFLMRLALIIICIIWASTSFGQQSQRAIFEAFQAEPSYDGPAAPPDLSPPDVHAYRTRVREAAALQANFNGHDRLIIWGCGTTCFMGAILDKKTGKVVLFPFYICCGEELSIDDPNPILFQENSSIVIFRGLRNARLPDGDHYYKFENSAFTFLRTIPPTAIAGMPATPKTADLPIEKENSAKICRSIENSAERLACFDRAFNGDSPKAQPQALLLPLLPAPVTPPQAQIDDPSIVNNYKKEIIPLLRNMSLARIAMSCGFRSETYYQFFLTAFDQKRQSLIKILHMQPGIVPGMAEDVKVADDTVVKNHPCAALSHSKELKDLDKIKNILAHTSQ